MRRALRGIPAAALLSLLALAAGCGGGGATSFPGGEHPAAGGGGELTYALAPVSGAIDPLHARTPAALTVSVQLFEPLVSSLRGPYRRGRGRLGLALGSGHSGDRRVW